MRSYVAMILSLCVLIFFLAGAAGPLLETWLRSHEGYTDHDVEVGTIWGDLITVLIGGLVAYIAGGKDNDNR